MSPAETTDGTRRTTSLGALAQSLLHEPPWGPTEKGLCSENPAPQRVEEAAEVRGAGNCAREARDLFLDHGEVRPKGRSPAPIVACRHSNGGGRVLGAGANWPDLVTGARLVLEAAPR